MKDFHAKNNVAKGIDIYFPTEKQQEKSLLKLDFLEKQKDKFLYQPKFKKDR